MRKVILEARINEYAKRDRNPHVPWSASEIATAARSSADAGASIIHFHARKPDGSPSHDYADYRDVVAEIRAVADVMIHPTLGVEALQAGAEERLDHVLRLAADGLNPDFAPLDMVSSNADIFDAGKRAFTTEDTVYVNTTGTLRYFAQTLRGADITPYSQIWHIPALRQMTAFLEAGYLDPPLFLSLAMTAGGFVATHPGTEAGLRAYFPFLPTNVAVHWTTALFGGNLLELIPTIVESGGHVSIGIGDYPYPELDHPENGRLIAEAARIIRDCGAEVATVEEARAMLGRNRVTVAA